MTDNLATLYLACAALTALVLCLNPGKEYAPRATPAALIAMALVWPVTWAFFALALYMAPRAAKED